MCESRGRLGRVKVQWCQWAIFPMRTFDFYYYQNSFRFCLFYLYLSIPLRFRKQWPERRENNKLRILVVLVK